MKSIAENEETTQKYKMMQNRAKEISDNTTIFLSYTDSLQACFANIPTMEDDKSYVTKYLDEGIAKFEHENNAAWKDIGENVKKW